MQSLQTSSIDDYIKVFIPSTQALLKQVRETIQKAAPQAEEKISYGIPTFTLYKKNLVHFGGYEHHIGFYPGSTAIEYFSKEISSYKNSKGSIQFPLDKVLPLKLISKIVTFRVKAEEERAQLKKKLSLIKLTPSLMTSKSNYVDGFVLIVPKNKVAEYHKMAEDGSKMWMECGALSYKECMLEDPTPESVVFNFPMMTKAKKDETIWFSYIEYKSKKHRDQVNAKVMKRMQEKYKDLKDQEMPFDMKRMAFGGFEVKVSG